MLFLNCQRHWEQI